MDNRLKNLAEQLDAGLIARREFLRKAAVITGGTATGLHALRQMATAQPKTKLRVWLFKSYVTACNDILAKHVEAWAKERNVEAEFDWATFGDREQKFVAAIEAGNPPDVAEMNYQGPMRYRPALRDVTKLAKEIAGARGGLLPYADRVMQFQGQYFGIAHQAFGGGLHVRKDLLAEKGVKMPKVYDPDVIDMAKKCQDASKDLWGFGQTLNRCDDGNGFIDREIASELCGMTRGDIMAATQRDRILKWLYDDGLLLPNLTAETVEDTLYEHPSLSKRQRRMLVLRQEGCRSSVSKYRALDEWRDEDTIRGLYVYYGANAHGRFAAKGPQPQNFPRGDAKCLDPEVKGAAAMELMVTAIKRTANDGKLSRLREQFRIEESEVFGDPRSPRHMIPAPPAEVLSTAIRGVFVAREGKTYGVGDYSAIEARKVFWFAGEKRGLKIMADGGDIYRDQASDIFDKPPEDLDVGFERMMGKTVILGCGYAMGWKKFKLTCKRSYGMVIEDELCQKSVYSYRDRYTAVPKLWKALDDAARRCIRTGRMIEAADGKLTFWMDDGDLKIRLPSERDIIMRSARISHDQIIFTNGKGYTETTYGGKICEYVCSGSARDVLADAIVMAEFDYDDVDPVMHSHDELVCEGEAGKVGKIVGEIMKIAVDAYEGLPMKIETFEDDRYHK